MMSRKEKAKINAKTYQMTKSKKLILPDCCNLCNSKKDLQIHHKKYTTKEGDIQLLCRQCHTKTHNYLKIINWRETIIVNNLFKIKINDDLVHPFVTHCVKERVPLAKHINNLIRQNLTKRGGL